MTFFKQLSSKSAILKMAAVFLIGSVIAMWGLTGCGDDADSYDAKMYDVIQALDDENWTAARAILETLPENSETLKYLSNTYAGDVGINTFDLLTTIDRLENTNGTGSIDMVGTLIGDEYGEMTCTEINGKLEKISLAIYYLDAIPNPDDDHMVELGLASLTRTVVIIAKLICLEGGGANVTMTKEWIENNKGSFLPISDAAWNNSPVADSFSDMLGDDITNVEAAVDVLADSNDIKDDFEEFRAELDNGQGGATANDSTIELSELNYYLDNV